MDLSVRQRHDPDGGITVSVHGEVDLHNADELTGVLLAAAGAAAPHCLRVDLADVPFVDSMGISALITAYQHAGTLGAGFRVVDVGSRVRRILAITGLLDLFGVTAHGAAPAGDGWSTPGGDVRVTPAGDVRAAPEPAVGGAHGAGFEGVTQGRSWSGPERRSATRLSFVARTAGPAVSTGE